MFWLSHQDGGHILHKHSLSVSFTGSFYLHLVTSGDCETVLSDIE